MSYIIPSILAFLGGFLLWLIKRDRLSLTYDLIESDVFPTNQVKGKYYILKIKNKGNRTIDDIRVKLDFVDGQILKPTISNPDLITDENISSSVFNCLIPSLNPKEIIQITITKELTSQLYNPIISLRAKGVNGQKEDEKDYSIIINSIVLPIVVTILIGYFGTTLIGKYVFKDDSSSNSKVLNEIKDSLNVRLNDIDKIRSQNDSLFNLEMLGAPDKQELIFSILNEVGLSNMIPQILRDYDDITYKNFGYLLFEHYLIDKSNKDKYLKALNKLGELKYMHPASNGIVYYLIYKINALEDDKINAQIAIDKCRKVAPLMEKHLLENDKYLDIGLFKKGIKY